MAYVPSILVGHLTFVTSFASFYSSRAPGFPPKAENGAKRGKETKKVGRELSVSIKERLSICPHLLKKKGRPNWAAFLRMISKMVTA